MKYKNAQDILPAELVEEIQKYTSGETIYIPKPRHTHIQWGVLTGARDYTKHRNHHIKEKYKTGDAVNRLAREYCLSVDSIKKIVYSK